MIDPCRFFVFGGERMGQIKLVGRLESDEAPNRSLSVERETIAHQIGAGQSGHDDPIRLPFNHQNLLIGFDSLPGMDFAAGPSNGQ